MSWHYKASSSPNCLFPAILRTCRLIYNEAFSVLYRENIFRAHRVDDTNGNAASIMRAKFVIGLGNPKDAEIEVSTLPKFLESHPNLEHLVLEFGLNLLENSELRNLISDVFLTFGYSSRLTVLSAFQSERASFNAARLENLVKGLAILRHDFPEKLKQLEMNLKDV